MAPHLRSRLDRALVSAGLARSRSQAQQLIDDGLVLIDGQVAEKPSEPVAIGQHLQVTEPDHYVSRAAHKLLGAFQDLAFALHPITGARVLDAGASTGGFTQVLLEAGAADVVAVDVGRDQLHSRLRSDRRVRSWERTNLRDLDLNLLNGRPVDLVVADVSFISLGLLIGPLVSVTSATGQLLLMVKPQFEVGRSRLGKGGVVRSPELHREAVQLVLDQAAEHGCRPVSAAPSRLPGPAGNREFFVLLEQGAGAGFDWPTALGLPASPA